MKTQIKTPVLVVVLVVFVAGILYWGSQALGNAGGLDHGQIKYTPGKPPWLDSSQNKQGFPGGPPAIDNRPK